jgi:diacylglycerol kinase (ATP)
MSIVTIVNRRARRLAEGERCGAPRIRGDGTGGSRALLEALRARRPGVRIVETRSMSELDAAAEDLARNVPDAIVLAGGDGSYMAGVTAIARAFVAAGRSEDALPPIGLAPGGTVSTVARNWGFRGGGLLSGGERDAARYASRLLDAIVARRAITRERPTLRATDDRATRIGFIFGAGLVSRFFEVYDEDGARGYRGAAKLVAQIFAGSFTHGALAQRVLTPVPCIVEIDGERAPFEAASLVCASVVRNLGIGVRLLYRAGEEQQRFHVVATPFGPSRLGPQLPLVLAGRPLIGAGRVDALARSLDIRFKGPASSREESDGGDAYVLDGELLRADRVTVTAGPVLRILSV